MPDPQPFCATFLSILSLFGATSALAETVSPSGAATVTFYGHADRKAKSRSGAWLDFTVERDDYRVNLGPRNTAWGTRVHARYRTRAIADLASFGVAQFVRGCQFSSRMERGKVVRILDVSRDHYGRSIVYRHPRWVIDGVSRDPLDWSFAQPSPFRSRHSHYRWNRTAGPIDESTARYLIDEPAARPDVFVTDRPGVASYDRVTGVARNVSLQFRTCLYRAGDVPAEVPPERLDFATPLACFDWTSSFVYDHRAGRMESPAGIDSICMD